MFDFGWGELLLIGIVALVVVGDDFPTMFRTLGRFTGKVRRMAREFQRAMEEAADEAGVKDASDALKGATNPSRMGLNKLNEAADRFENWDPTKASSKTKTVGEATSQLSEERAEAARKIREYSTERSAAKTAADEEAAAAEAAADEADVAEADAADAAAETAEAPRAKDAT